MSIELWIAFVATSAVLLIMPGPTVLTIISYSLAHGRRVKAPLVTAVALADSTGLTLSLLGLGALLTASPFWYNVLKFIGGFYLLYLGYSWFRAGTLPANPADGGAKETRWKLSLNTYLVSVLNPQAIVFFVAFLPQFVNPDGNVTQQLWMLALTFITMGMLNSTLFAIFASAAQRFLSTPRVQRIFQICGGTALIAFGIGALLAQQG